MLQPPWTGEYKVLNHTSMVGRDPRYLESLATRCAIPTRTRPSEYALYSTSWPPLFPVRTYLTFRAAFLNRVRNCIVLTCAITLPPRNSTSGYTVLFRMKTSWIFKEKQETNGACFVKPGKLPLLKMGPGMTPMQPTDMDIGRAISQHLDYHCHSAAWQTIESMEPS